MEDLLLLDAANPDVRVQFAMAEAEYSQRAENAAAAAKFAAIEAALREAREFPQTFLGFSRLTGQDAIEMAERAAVADLATRMTMSENTVRANGYVAQVLRERASRVWAWFREGEISTANAREVAALATELPTEVWAAFDDQVVEYAKTLAPARFRAKARSLRERLHTESLEVRHERAQANRRVSVEVDRDGMGWLHALLPAHDLALITAQLDQTAFGLFANGGETRTMNQLRADVLVDLLTGNAAGAAPGVTVALTVPLLSLLGQSTEPAIMEGVGPIDQQTARRLCGDATSFTRILTDPVTGSMLALDPQKYRSNAATRRWLGHRDVTCTFPGCGRRASGCDIDHITAWNGSNTTIDNLHHLCRKHHRMKHETKWEVEKPPDGPSRWTSPTGNVAESNPPPY